MNLSRSLLMIPVLFACAMLALRPADGQISDRTMWEATAHDILKQLVEINTTDSTGSLTRAAEQLSRILASAGFPAADIDLVGEHPRKKNLIVRLHGNGLRRPLLLLAHLDVVDARRQDWSVDPFTLLERDGYYYGRGTSDDKDMAAIWIANLIRLKKEGFIPDRDIIVALTADEEQGDFNGVQWLVKRRRDLIDAAVCLNEGGGGSERNGKRIANEVQASEKVYLSFSLEVKNRGGHSSLPTRDNAIYRLASGLVRLSQYSFPVRLTEVTRTFFARSSLLQQGWLAEDMKTIGSVGNDSGAAARLSTVPYYNALLRTTGVATRLMAGHADNALPQTAFAIVNCRLLPGDSADSVKSILERVVADSQIVVRPIGVPKPSPPSPLSPEILGPIQDITAAMWPGIPVIPVMGTGATDGLHLRIAGIPTYGVSGIFEDMDDIRAHGKDERIGVREFYEGQEFLYRLVKRLCTEQ